MVQSAFIMPLSKYKRMMPTFWQMVHGEKSVGLAIHHIRSIEVRFFSKDQLAINPANLSTN
jgi:hypothetical protein